MYNRYIPNGTGYTRILEEDAPAAPPPAAPVPPPAPEPEPHPPAPTQAFLPLPPRSDASPDAPEEEKKGLLTGLLKSLKLEKLDSGDILLLLIILFIFLEGDDIELLIALGLFLVLGLE